MGLGVIEPELRIHRQRGYQWRQIKEGNPGHLTPERGLRGIFDLAKAGRIDQDVLGVHHLSDQAVVAEAGSVRDDRPGSYPEEAGR